MKTTRPAALPLITGVILSALLAAPASAITDEEIFRDFRFNFANPGARALAMGGAFIAIANDATAAQANPARLGVLRRPEVFVEIRSRTTEASGADTPTFFIDPATNPAATLQLTSSIEPEAQTIPSVISFVWPFKMRRALTVGFSRQEILAVQSSTTNSFVLVPVSSSFAQDPNNPEDVTNSSVGSIKSNLVLYNLSGGYQITRDLFVGGSVIFGQLDLTSDIVSTFSDADAQTGLFNVDPRFQTFPGAPIITTSIDDSATDVKWSFGAFWKLNDLLSFGTVYKKGLTMAVDEFVDERFASRTRTIETTFNVPDVAGFGASYQPFARSANSKAQSLLFAVDVVRVENHDLVEGFTPQLNVLTLPIFIQDIEFTADNQTEIHLGAEYYFGIGRSTLALRAGFFTDPDSSVRAVRVGRDAPGVTGFKDAIVKGEAFPGRDDETHITGGVGFSYADFEVAAAFDSSNIETQSLISVIYRFKR